MMADLATQFNLVWVGFGIGVLVGLTGVGGGALMTPILIVVFRLPPSLAIGTDLVNAAFMKILGAYQHWRQGTVKVRIVITLALGSVPAAVLGVGVIKLLKEAMGNAGEAVLTLILAWTLILVSAIMILRVVLARLTQTAVVHEPRPKPRHRKLVTIILGLGAGILVSLTSVGAGSIVMVFLVALYTASAKRLVGTDIVHAAILASVSALGHLWAGNVDFGVAAMLLTGSLPGVLLGSRLSVRMPDMLLRVVLALTLMFSGMRLIVH
jgi:uncharacterized membrane protein YfcA